MLYSIDNRQELEKIEELVSLQDQVNEVRLQDKLGEPNFQQITSKLFEPMTDAIKNASENITKTITETSEKNKKVLEDLSEIILELINDKGMIAPYLVSSLVNLFTPENTSQFRLKKTLIQLR